MSIAMKKSLITQSTKGGEYFFKSGVVSRRGEMMTSVIMAAVLHAVFAPVLIYLGSLLYDFCRFAKWNYLLSISIYFGLLCSSVVKKKKECSRVVGFFVNKSSKSKTTPKNNT